MNKTPSSIPRISTCVKGLDDMLRGGIPKDRVILLCGGPGVGKTILSLQILALAAENGIHGIYATLEESLALIRQNIKAFSWKMEEKERDRTVLMIEPHFLSHEFSDGRNQGKEPTSLFLENITETARSIEAELLVIDPLTSLIINEQRAGEKRRKIAWLFSHLRKSGCTSILTSESSSSAFGEFYMEEFLADGIIRLDKVIQDFNLVRTLRVEKMRGVEHDDQPRRYVVNHSGFTVYSTEPVKV